MFLQYSAHRKKLSFNYTHNVSYICLTSVKCNSNSPGAEKISANSESERASYIFYYSQACSFYMVKSGCIELLTAY